MTSVDVTRRTIANARRYTIVRARRSETLVVEHFSTLNDLLALVGECECTVNEIHFTPAAHDGYLEAREILGSLDIGLDGAPMTKADAAFCAALRDKCRTNPMIVDLDAHGQPVTDGDDDEHAVAAPGGDAE